MITRLLKVAEDYEKKLKDWYLKERRHLNYDSDPESEGKLSHQDLLIQLGIIPLLTTGKDAYLGRGDFSTVYQVIYKGKPAVAKITTNVEDVYNIVSLFNLKEQLGELGKHLPTVYDWFEYPEADQTIYIIVVELLNKTSLHINQVLFSHRPENKQKIVNRFKDRYFVLTFVNILLEQAQVPASWDEDKVEKFTELLNQFFLKENFTFPLTVDIINKFVLGFRSLVLNFIDQSNDEEKKFLTKIQMLLSTSLKNLTYDFAPIFPANVNMGKDIWANILPESASLMKLLHKLKEMGIYWSDLKYGNLMERPSTGELVISDPGLFDFT